jgi:hypothetical protein
MAIAIGGFSGLNWTGTQPSRVDAIASVERWHSDDRSLLILTDPIE